VITAIEERWKTILEFPRYEISNRGNIYNNYQKQFMQISQNNFGNMKITLTDYDGARHTRSVAQLVAEAFVSPPNELCDRLIVLDGDVSNVSAENLAWRPRWFAQKYSRQLKITQPIHYHNLAVLDCMTGVEYDSIVDAGIAEGLLFEQIWQSTYRGNSVYPTGSVFEIVQRV
jgi:hypothetical protein